MLFDVCVIWRSQGEKWVKISNPPLSLEKMVQTKKFFKIARVLLLKK